LAAISKMHDPVVQSMALAALATWASMRVGRDYSAEYRKRRTKRPELTARQAAGHPGPGDVLPTAEALYVRRPDGSPATLYGARVSRRDIRRVARYLALVAQVNENRMDREAFRRRISTWRPIVVLGPPDITGSYRFLDDPDAASVLSDLERTAERQTWIDSGRRRPTQRRRTR
jgi:hypothetical protein